jgi:hypothetical protein
VIGWTEPDDTPNLQTITVDADLALWAAGAAVELEQAMPEFVLDDEDLDALSGLKLIAGAQDRRAEPGACATTALEPYFKKAVGATTPLVRQRD